MDPWLGFSADDIRDHLVAGMTHPRFKERWKYTSIKKVFGLTIADQDDSPKITGLDQPGVTQSKESSKEIKTLISPDLINEKIIMVGQTKSPLSIRISEPLEKPIQLTHRQNCSAIFFFIGPGVKCEINEYFEGSQAQQHAIWLRLEPNSQVVHSRQSLNSDAWAWKYLNLGQESQSSYKLHCHNVGGKLKRDDFDINIDGDRASFELKSASYVGAGQHLDQQISLRHLGRDTFSDQQIHNVGDSQSTATCNGRILIEKQASRTNAALSNKNLSLGDNVTFNAKPELEIYNDDVTCSHGATIGQLSDSELFYLTSRGIGPANAKRLVARGFLNKALDGPLEEKSTQHFKQFFSDR